MLLQLLWLQMKSEMATRISAALLLGAEIWKSCATGSYILLPVVNQTASAINFKEKKVRKRHVMDNPEPAKT